MKYLISLIVTLCVTLFAASAFAFTAPPAPDTGYIVDRADVLSNGEISSLNSKIDNIKASTENEIGILVLASLGGENIEDVTHAVFKEWKVGKLGKDNGVLIVLAVNDRKIRIQTGKDVEGDLTDLQANDIIQKMKPLLKSKNYVGALGLAVDNINSTLESRKVSTAPASTPKPTTSSADETGLATLIIAIPVIGGLLFALIFWLKNKKSSKKSSSYYSTPSFSSSSSSDSSSSWGSSSGSDSGGFSGGDSGGGGASGDF